MFARYISCCHSFTCLSSFSTCKIETLQSPLIWFHELIIAVLSWEYNNSHPALNADNSLPLCYTIYTLLKENSSCQKRNLREMSRGVKLPLVPSHYNQLQLSNTAQTYVFTTITHHIRWLKTQNFFVGMTSPALTDQIHHSLHRSLKPARLKKTSALLKNPRHSRDYGVRRRIFCWEYFYKKFTEILQQDITKIRCCAPKTLDCLFPRPYC